MAKATMALVAPVQDAGVVEDGRVVDDPTTVASEDVRLMVVPLAALVPGERNPRAEVRDLGGLAASIRARGVVQALTVLDVGDGRFQIVAGHRRAAAAALAGLDAVPCLVRPQQGRGAADEVLDALVENVHRQGLSDAEQVAGVRQLVVELGMSAKAVGEQTGFGVPMARRLARVARDEAATQSVAAGLDLEQALVVAEWAGDRAAQEALVAAAEAGRSAFDRQVRALRADRAIATAVAELRGAGTVAHDQSGWAEAAPPAAVRVSHLRDGDGQRLGDEAHAGCPGRVVVVDTDYRGEVEVDAWCTDPDTHGHLVPSWARPSTHGAHSQGSAGGTEGDGGAAEADAAREAARVERRRVIRCNREFRASKAARVAHVAGLLKARTAPKGTLDLVLRLVGAGACNDSPTVLAEILAVTAEPGTYRPQRDLLATWVGPAPTDPRRLLGLLAVVGAHAEATALTDGAWRHPNRDGVAAAWLGWLSTTGYDPGPVERLAVGLMTPEQVDAAHAGDQHESEDAAHAGVDATAGVEHDEHDEHDEQVINSGEQVDPGVQVGEDR